jgi:hypothetical protein
VSKVDIKPAENPGERLHGDASGPLPPSQGIQEYCYSGDYFMANKSLAAAILRRHIS